MHYAIVLVALLAGCVTPQERAEQILARYGPFCERLGFTPGTEAFANCVQQQYATDLLR